jgi:hypothetical protein
MTMRNDDQGDDAQHATSLAAGLAEAARFQRDLYLYWHAAQRMGGLALTSRGYITRLALRRVRERLAAGHHDPTPFEGAEMEEPRLYFLRRLLERLRLLRLAPDAARLVAAERSEMGRYVALPLAERLRLATRLWVAGGWWPDHVEASARPPRLLTPAPPRLALARRQLLDKLVSLPPGAALHVPPGRTGPLQRQRSRTAKSAAAQRALTAPDGALETWRAALLGPLTWLGLAFASPETDAGREWRGVGEAGAVLAAEGQSASLTEQHGALTLLPNLTLLAYPPLTAPELWLLDACADEATFQQTASYTLTREALARARKAGLAARDVTRRLEELAGSALPPNVRTTLDDWERHAARIQVTPNACVLEVREAALLDALLADAQGMAWIERRLAPRLALLTPEGMPRAREWLLQRGELPSLLPLPDSPQEGRGG